MDERSVAFQMAAGRIPVRFLARADCIRLTRDRRGRALVTAPRALGCSHTRAFIRGWAGAEAMPLRAEDADRLLAFAGGEAERLCEPLGVPVPEVAVMAFDRFWGLCSLSTGLVRLHRSISRMPDGVATETLAHELCHLREPAHSPSFWALMDELLPDWPVWEGVLRCLGERIHAERN